MIDPATRLAAASTTLKAEAKRISKRRECVCEARLEGQVVHTDYQAIRWPLKSLMAMDLQRKDIFEGSEPSEENDALLNIELTQGDAACLA